MPASLSFEQIAPIVDRTPVAAKKLASRARRRVRGAAPNPDPDLSSQRRVVDAFLAAARGGDVAALVAILDPDVVLRADGGMLTGGMKVIRGAASVAGQLATFQRMATSAATHPALVNGLAGLVNTIDGKLISVMSFTISDGKIARSTFCPTPTGWPSSTSPAWSRDMRGHRAADSGGVRTRDRDGPACSARGGRCPAGIRRRRTAPRKRPGR
ncbi:hypothetical protein ACQP2K_23355 [Microbispora siamensis]